MSFSDWKAERFRERSIQFTVKSCVNLFTVQFVVSCGRGLFD